MKRNIREEKKSKEKKKVKGERKSNRGKDVEISLVNLHIQCYIN